MLKFCVYSTFRLLEINKLNLVFFATLIALYIPTESSLAFQPPQPKIEHRRISYDDLVKIYEDAFLNSSFILAEKRTSYFYSETGSRYPTKFVRSGYLRYTFKDTRYPSHVATAEISIEEEADEKQLCDPCSVFISGQHIDLDMARPDVNKDTDKKARIDMSSELKTLLDKAVRIASEKIK